MGAKGSCTLQNQQEMQRQLLPSAGENRALFPEEIGTRVQAEMQILASLPGVETGLAMAPDAQGIIPAPGGVRLDRAEWCSGLTAAWPDRGGGDKAVGGIETLLLCPSPLP